MRGAISIHVPLKRFRERAGVIRRIVFLFDTHENRLGRMAIEKADAHLEHIAEVSVLEDLTMVYREHVVYVPAADIYCADAERELRLKSKRLGFRNIATVVGHRVMRTGYRQVADSKIAIELAHPFGRRKLSP